MRKPRKVKNILFTAIHDRDFRVYSDLSKEQLEAIPGVVFVYSKTNGAHEVTTSPLYDIEEIMGYIEWLVEEKQCECECEARTFVMYCNIPVDDLRRIPGVESVRKHPPPSSTYREIAVGANCDMSMIRDYIFWLMNRG